MPEFQVDNKNKTKGLMHFIYFSSISMCATPCRAAGMQRRAEKLVWYCNTYVAVYAMCRCL